MNAQPAVEFVRSWRTSSYSNGGDNCVEFAVTADGRVAIRDSKNPDQPPQFYARSEWRVFLDGAKDSEFGGSTRREAVTRW